MMRNETTYNVRINALYWWMESTAIYHNYVTANQWKKPEPVSGSSQSIGLQIRWIGEINAYADT